MVNEETYCPSHENAVKDVFNLCQTYLLQLWPDYFWFNLWVHFMLPQGKVCKTLFQHVGTCSWTATVAGAVCCFLDETLGKTSEFSCGSVRHKRATLWGLSTWFPPCWAYFFIPQYFLVPCQTHEHYGNWNDDTNHFKSKEKIRS